MRVVPSAKAAATARIGNSSIIDGAISGSVVVPRRALAVTSRSPTVSPLSMRSFVTVMLAPMRLRTVMRPARVGFSMTRESVSFDPGTRIAATSGKAAEEGSGGTTTGRPVSDG